LIRSFKENQRPAPVTEISQPSGARRFYFLDCPVLDSAAVGAKAYFRWVDSVKNKQKGQLK